LSNAPFQRTDRVAVLVHRAIAEIFLRHPEKPYFKQVTVTGVKMSKDLAHAKVFVTLLKEEENSAAIKSLNHDTKFVRYKLAQTVNLRITPELLFVYDASVIEGQKLAAKINAAVSEDLARHKQDEAK
jgi:ribosome-binding factor A